VYVPPVYVPPVYVSPVYVSPVYVSPVYMSPAGLGFSETVGKNVFSGSDGDVAVTCVETLSQR
jgi:hypothetical protein